MTGSDFPILEFDAAREALIEPSKVWRPVADLPDRAVACFFQDVIEEVCGDGRGRVVGRLKWEHGVHPLYDLERDDGRRVTVFHPGVGAPLAAGLLEEVIAHGCRAFVACGGAGALVPGLALGHVVVPTAAVRDEGTSYHYAPPSREIEADVRSVSVAVSVLERRGIPHTTGKTWTTDAPYRETAARIERRRAEGCITVEMESAAFFAVARHRGVPFAQYLYAGDDVSGETWDDRAWQSRSSARRELFELAADAVLEL
jgi:uridine phosphorylase